MLSDMIHEVEIAAKPQTIYRAITTREGEASFWVPNNTMSPKVGHVAAFQFKGAPVPHRRGILGLVRERELPVVEIAARFPGVSRPAVSQHLRVLCDAGLLSMRRSGRNSFYRAREDRIDRLRAYLDTFWGDRLAAL